jgi:hypothetical protein
MGRVAFTDEITAYDPGQRTYSERVNDSMIRGSGSRWSVESAGGRSRLAVDALVRANGGWRLIEPFMVWSAKRDMARALDRLQRILEKPQN